MHCNMIFVSLEGKWNQVLYKNFPECFLSLWLSIVWPMGLTLYRPRHYFWHFLGLLLLLPCRLELLQEGRKKPGTCLQLAARPGQLGSGGSSLQFWALWHHSHPLHQARTTNHPPRLLPLHLLLRNTIQRSSVLLYTHTMPLLHTQ